MTRSALKFGKPLLLLFLFVVVAVALLFLPFREWFLKFESYVRELGVLGPVAMVVIYIAAAVLLIPGSALTIACGTLFGFPAGFLTAFTGANLGAWAAFVLARSRLRGRIARWADGSGRLRSLDRAIGDEGFRVVLLSRLSPVLPFTLLNYFFGLTAVRPGAYVLGNLLGMLPGAFLYVYVGVAARDALAGNVQGAFGIYQQALKYVGLLATIAVVVVVTRLARKALRAAEQTQDGTLIPEKASG